MSEKEKWRPMPFFGSNRQLEKLLDDLRWEEATESALKKHQEEYRAANPKRYEKEDKKYKTG